MENVNQVHTHVNPKGVGAERFGKGSMKKVKGWLSQCTKGINAIRRDSKRVRCIIV